jgi:glutamate synthase (NADPH/NADH) small chain
MEKRFLDRRLEQMTAEGVVFRTNAHVGVNVPVAQLRTEYDAVLLSGGATAPRDLKIPGRELSGVYFAMEFLSLQNRRNEGDQISDDRFISAAGKHVIIIGGGDTGADCLGTVLRQGAASVHQFELLPRPPAGRAAGNPWPEWPNIFRVSSAHEEGGERVFSVSTEEFLGDNGRVTALRAVDVERVQKDGRVSFAPVPGTERTMPADLVLLAMGFVGPEKGGLLSDLGVTLTDRGNVWADEHWMTSVPGVFTAGDMQRGQSLIVWAIAEGRSAARGIDAYLMGHSDLPAPVAR